ncbi:MAG: hypothetical protein SGILL_007193 [Bacillariaceae sp.]
MVVFDKDGTLGDCTGSLRKWVFFMADRARDVLESANDDIIQELYEDLGWNTTIDNVIPSAPVAAGTWGGAMQIVYDFLQRHKDKCNSIVTLEMVQEWHHELGDLHGQDEPLIDDLRGMLEQCQAMGYLVAVCTSDDKAATKVALKTWGVDDVVNVTICGDEVAQGKPSAVPMHELCNRTNLSLEEEGVLKDASLRISPQDCVMVGDTTADTGMALAANVGLCAGVLTGSGTEEQLLGTGAHLVVPDVGYIPDLLKVLEGGLKITNGGQ